MFKEILKLNNNNTNNSIENWTKVLNMHLSVEVMHMGNKHK